MMVAAGNSERLHDSSLSANQQGILGFASFLSNDVKALRMPVELNPLTVSVTTAPH